MMMTLLAAVLIATSGECLGGDADANIDIAALMEHARERPSLIVPRAKLGEIRLRARGDAPARKWWKGFEAHVRGDFVEREVVVPRGLAQWVHYYSCRKCGSQLKAHSPTNHVCPECGEKHTGWPYDQACNYFAHTRAEDFGCISYGNPLHWHWYRSTLAHTTVTMDGVNQRQGEGRCLSFKDDGRCAKIACEVGPDAFPGATATRSLFLEGDRLVDVFTVESADEHDWEWAFHARGNLSTSVTTASVQPPPRDEEKIKGFVSRANGSDAWGWTECLREGETRGEWSACWRKDGRSVLDARQTIEVDGRTAPVCRVRTAVVCAQPPPEKAELIACRVRGRKAVFRTEYDLSGCGFALGNRNR